MPINNISPDEVEEIIQLVIKRLQEQPELLQLQKPAAEEEDEPAKPKRGRPKRK